MRQHRLGVRIADAIGQAGNGIETVDRDLVAGSELRAQTGLPQASIGPCQKVTMSGSMRVSLGVNQGKEKAPALSAPGLELEIDLRPRRARA